jgi:hypothetical protein
MDVSSSQQDLANQEGDNKQSAEEALQPDTNQDQESSETAVSNQKDVPPSGTQPGEESVKEEKETHGDEVAVTSRASEADEKGDTEITQDVVDHGESEDQTEKDKVESAAVVEREGKTGSPKEQVGLKQEITKRRVLFKVHKVSCMLFSTF